MYDIKGFTRQVPLLTIKNREKLKENKVYDKMTILVHNSHAWRELQIVNNQLIAALLSIETNLPRGLQGKTSSNYLKPTHQKSTSWNETLLNRTHTWLDGAVWYPVDPLLTGVPKAESADSVWVTAFPCCFNQHKKMNKRIAQNLHIFHKPYITNAQNSEILLSTWGLELRR